MTLTACIIGLAVTVATYAILTLIISAWEGEK